MNRTDVYTPPGGMPKVDRPNPEIYQHMGQENITRMMIDFYSELEKSSIRDLFPRDMKAAAEKSALFFIFLLGGPPLYQQQVGQPMMRARHMPFRITEQARQEWMRCFKTTLVRAPESYMFHVEHLQGFIDFLEGFSRWMVNTGPDDKGVSLPLIPGG